MWGDPQETSFQRLKDLPTQADTLAYFKNECRTRIVADAGPTGIGAVLTQLQNGMWRVISYASRNLTDVERRYSQTEKEGLALVWACERFKLHVYGHEFELEADHKPLKYIYDTSSKPSARLERWILRLQGYNFKVIYLPGKTNIADALSRLNCMVQKDPSGEEADFFLKINLFTIQTLTLLMLLSIPCHTYITNNINTYTYNTKYLICFFSIIIIIIIK